MRRRPQEWRLACQALVDRSLLVLTRPQVRLPDAEARLAAARQAPLPDGPTAWPVPPEAELEESEDEVLLLTPMKRAEAQELMAA